MKVGTDRAVPCEAAHKITLEIDVPEGVPLLVMNFPHPFIVNRIQATLSRSDRSIQLVLPKALNEPLPRHFGQKPLWKVEELNPLQNSTEDMMKHSVGMMDGTQLSKAMADSFLPVGMSRLSSLMLVRGNINSLMLFVNMGCEIMTACLKDLKTVWTIRVHPPVLCGPNGSPVFLISAFDHPLSEQFNQYLGHG